MRSDPTEFRELREALDEVVARGDAISKQALETGSPAIFSLASDAIQTAAAAVFALLDARTSDTAPADAMKQARAGLASARASLHEAEKALAARGSRAAPELLPQGRATHSGPRSGT